MQGAKNLLKTENYKITVKGYHHPNSKRKEIEMRVEKRIQDEINKKADLEKELERNAVLEATILKWTNYKNKGQTIR